MPAYARLAAASALAVSLAVFALPAAAADLYEPPYEGYGEGPPPPDRYADVPDDFEPPYPPPAYAGRDRCVPREVARDRLRAAGWRGFHAIEPRDGVVLVKARRPSGRMFDLTIDRCSGEVVDAKPIYGYGPRYGGFAGGPRRVLGPPLLLSRAIEPRWAVAATLRRLIWCAESWPTPGGAMELVSLAKNPVPSGGTVGAFQGYDGAELRYARWDATRMPRRGTVCLFGGRAEFIEKYFEVIADLRRRGFAVATMDWRGQGGSQRMLANPRKGYVRGFWEYDRDLIRFMKDIVLPDCPPPFIGLGHSMGGNILLRNATMPGLWFERIVLTAPMIAISESCLGTTPNRAAAYAEVASLLGTIDRLCGRRLRRSGLGPEVRGQLAHLRLRALAAHQGGAGSGALARPRLADRRLAAGRRCAPAGISPRLTFPRASTCRC